MVSFGKTYYDYMLIITAKDGKYIHCKTISMNPDKGPTQRSIKGNLGRIDDDPVFSTVDRSGIAFFGKSFPCELLNQVFDKNPRGECALIPMLIDAKVSFFCTPAAKLIKVGNSALYGGLQKANHPPSGFDSSGIKNHKEPRFSGLHAQLLS